MKNTFFLVFFASILCIFSCKNEPKSPITEPEVMEMTPEDEDVTIACYRFTNDKDTILLNFENDHSKIFGTLQYHYFEKDKNMGFIEGIMVGDTLFADYTYFSEGLESVREVAFLKKGTTIVEGYSDIEVDGNTSVFKDGAIFNFNHPMVLTITDCN